MSELIIDEVGTMDIHLPIDDVLISKFKHRYSENDNASLYFIYRRDKPRLFLKGIQFKRWLICIESNGDEKSFLEKSKRNERKIKVHEAPNGKLIIMEYPR